MSVVAAAGVATPADRLPLVRTALLAALAAAVACPVGGRFEYSLGDTAVLVMAVTRMALPFTLVRHPALTVTRS